MCIIVQPTGIAEWYHAVTALYKEKLKSTSRLISNYIFMFNPQSKSLSNADKIEEPILNFCSFTNSKCPDAYLSCSCPANILNTTGDHRGNNCGAL
jgi:hypothetical protein